MGFIIGFQGLLLYCKSF
ncbi:MAG: hypothetical protein ACUVTM_02775 [Candidatus Bathyarchaeia archaeon]